MIPFAIQWDFTSLAQIPENGPVRRSFIEQEIFEVAGGRWANVLKGWPEQDQSLILPGGDPLSHLAIKVVLTPFPKPLDDASGRVPPETIRRLQAPLKPFAYAAEIHVDLADLGLLLLDLARFLDTIIHEIGHALGLGTAWSEQDDVPLVDRSDPTHPVYAGVNGLREYRRLIDPSAVRGIPVTEESPGSTTAYHWSEAALRWDIMSTELDQPVAGHGQSAGSNVISAISVGALADLGYAVDINQAGSLPQLPANQIAVPLVISAN